MSDVSGILLLDKPAGPTSNRALQEIKRLFGASKAGHTGSLDPLASGLLPICLGEATKISQFLLDADKHYRFELKLGIATETDDAEGAPIATAPVPALSLGDIEAVLAGFRGAIEQVPPRFSAIKRAGQPFYRGARQGDTTLPPVRRIQVTALRLVRAAGDTLELEAHASKGTYVRSLGRDIGAALGCGAHVTSLRRLATGPFRIEGAHTYEALKALPATERLAALLPMDEVLTPLPAVRLDPASERSLCHGQVVFIGHTAAPGWARLYGAKAEFIGLGELLPGGRVAPKRLLATTASG